MDSTWGCLGNQIPHEIVGLNGSAMKLADQNEASRDN